jgi:hypothetical protein
MESWQPSSVEEANVDACHKVVVTATQNRLGLMPPAGSNNAAGHPDARDTERHPPLAHFLSSLNQSILQTLMVSLANVVQAGYKRRAI